MLLALGGCYRRVEVPLTRAGAGVTCFGEDHALPESDFSVTARKLCVASCQRHGFTPQPEVVDRGDGLASRQNPGVPGVCL